MKLLTLLFTGLILFSCGGSDDAANTAGSCQDSPFIGSWSGNIAEAPDTMIFQEDCTGESSHCGSVFTYPSTTNNQGTVKIEVSANNGNVNCLPVGETSCTYVVDDIALEFTCGGDVLSYSKL